MLVVHKRWKDREAMAGMSDLPIHEAIKVACAGLDQRVLAAGVGVDQSTISRWMRGETQPTFEKLMRLEIVAGRPRGFVLRLAGMVDDDGSARHALDQDEALTAEAKAILVAAYDAAVAAAAKPVLRIAEDGSVENRPGPSAANHHC